MTSGEEGKGRRVSKVRAIDFGGEQMITNLLTGNNGCNYSKKLYGIGGIVHANFLDFLLYFEPIIRKVN